MKKIICNFNPFTYTQTADLVDLDKGTIVESIPYTLDTVDDKIEILLSKYNDIDSLDLYGLKPMSKVIEKAIIEKTTNYSRYININIK